MTSKQMILLLCVEQRPQCLDFALEPRAPDFEIITLGLDVLEFRLQGAHLVNALLAVAARSHGVGFALFDFGGLCEGTAR